LWEFEVWEFFVHLFKVVDEVALLYGFITFRAIDHGLLALKVGGAMSG